MTFFSPVTLQGRHATLEPLTPDHRDALIAAALDGELWKLWYTTVPHPDQMQAYIDKALHMQAEQSALPFAIRDSHGEIVGCTRFCNADGESRRVEIGYTWHARRAQRSGINTECKLMLMTHAFETLKCIAVEFRTHWLNHQSRAAIERLGARQDGVLRNHKIMPDGSYRDTVIFSVIESEWPAVKRHLQFRLER
jgi:RimJ/RimL family protein N-acetyltransferase